MDAVIKTVALRLALALYGAALPFGLNATEPQVVMPTTAQAWAELARQDIEAAYQITAANHPGMA
ncbi:MAG: peptidase, partial [Pararheinheimera sp.]|nr:peptidase [Rheinheimera sp.]